MNLPHRAVVALRVVLVLAFLLLLLIQAMAVPGQFSHMAEEEPGLAYLRWPLTAWAIGLLLCAQVVLVCTWQLLGLVDRDRIFSEGSRPWVDAIVWAIGAGWLLVLAAFGFFAVAELRPDDGLEPEPPLALMLILLLVVGAGLGLLMIVMRALLLQATTLRTEMEEVI